MLEDEIREAAYYKWEKMGRPWLDEEGKRKLWLLAQRELLKSRGQPYRILFQQESDSQKVEIRKYYPQRRVIIQNRREYYLQFPYLIFAGRMHPTGNYLYVGFAKEEDDVVYFPSVPNMNPQTWGICLGRSGGHFQQSTKSNLDSLIQLFWITEFDDWGLGWRIAHNALVENFCGRLNYWKKLNLSQVLEHITYMPTTFETFVSKVSQHYGDYEMRVLISNSAGCPSPKKKATASEDDAIARFFGDNSGPKLGVDLEVVPVEPLEHIELYLDIKRHVLGDVLGGR